MTDRAATTDVTASTPPAEVIKACRRGLELLPQYQPSVPAAVKKRAEQLVAGGPLSKNMLGRLRTYCEQLLKQPHNKDADNIPLLLGGGYAAKAWLWPDTMKVERKGASGSAEKDQTEVSKKRKRIPVQGIKKKEKRHPAPTTKKTIKPLKPKLIKKSEPQVHKVLLKPSPFEAKVYRDRPAIRKAQSQQTQSILNSFLRPKRSR